MEKIIRTNKLIFLVQGSLIVICNLLSNGTLLQTLLITLGFSNRLIYIHSTLMQAVNVATLLLFTRKSDTNNMIRKFALLGLPSGILLLCYIPFCLRSTASWKAFAIILIIGGIQVVVSAIRTCYNFTLPYLLYPAEDYGTMVSISGTVAYSLSFAIGYILSSLSDSIPYVVLMVGVFSLCALLEFAGIRLTLMQKAILSTENSSEKHAGKNTPQLSRTLKHPAFTSLILPTVMRGFAFGVINVLATVAFDLGFDESVTIVMVSINSIASILSCTSFGFIEKRVPSRILVFVGSISFVLLPLVFVRNKTIFLLVYGLVLIGKVWVDNGVPTLLRHIVPLEIAGSYNVLRMLLHTGGGLIATSVATMVSSKILILLTVVLSVMSGIGYLCVKSIKNMETVERA